MADTTMVVAHGAWSAGWSWRKMHPLLRAAGVDLRTPTYTGLGDRRHLLSPDITLSTHITDLSMYLETEDLDEVVLVAHSYGGMVGTAVVDRHPERIRRIVYLDAFVPSHGQSLFDLVGGDVEAAMRSSAGGADPEGGRGGWMVTPNPTPPDTSDADLAWIAARRGPQPIGTFSEAIELHGPIPTRPRAYIYCRRHAPGDVFAQFAEVARDDPSWSYRELDASHSPHVTAPELLCDTLVGLL